MRIGTRLFFALLLPIVGVIATFAYFDQRRSESDLRRELAREGRSLARAARLGIEPWLAAGDSQRARLLIDDLTGYERVLGLRWYDEHGRILYQSRVLDAHPPIHPEAVASVLRDDRAVATRRTIDNDPVMTFIEPLHATDGRVVGAVQVLQLESFIRDDARASRRAIVLLAAVTIVVVGAIVLLGTRWTVGRSVESLARAFRQVRDQDLPARVPETQPGELRRIAAEFNRMCERLAAARVALLRENEERLAMEARLRLSEHLAGIGRVSAGLAHEIGSPLNVVLGRTETLERRLSGDPEARRNLAIIATQIERITRTVRDVLEFARRRDPVLAPTDVPRVVRDVLEFLEQRLAERGAAVVLEPWDRVPPIAADADQLHQVFLNLLTNAIDALPAAGRIRISCGLAQPRGAEATDAPRSWLRVAIEDNGEGISAADLERMFEPFYSTKDIGKGTGLGLSISYAIVRDHGGWIDAERRAGGGARFSVFLPAEPRQAAPTEAR